MPLSNSNLRRYTPPTCTLEIAGKTSPLSRFAGKSILKDLRFELRFDDPRQPDDTRVTIRGDQTELEMLCEAVNSYVQNFLESPSTQLPLLSRTVTAASSSTSNENASQDFLASPASNVMNSDAIASRPLYAESNTVHDSGLDSNLQGTSKLRSLKSRSLTTDIYLEPKGLLAHNLILGHLATEESGPFVKLSVTQLFDLATALDEYTAEAVGLPKLNVLRWKKAPPAWASTAAAVVVAVGVTAAAMKYFDQPKTQPVTTASKPLTPTPPPAPATPTPTASIALLPTPTVPLPLSTAPTMPPPSRVNVPSTPAPLNNLPLGSQRSANSSLGNQRPTTTIPMNPAEPPGTPAKRSNPSILPGGIASRPNSPNSIAASPTIAISKRKSSPSSPEKPATQSSKPSLPEAAPSLPDLPSLKPGTSTASNSGEQSSPSASARTTSPSAQTNQSAPAPSDTVDRNNTLFDKIPQVGEVRDYLQQRWKPPSGLTQILEYYVVLNMNGTVERIIPINSSAVENLNRTNIPMPGEPFVSAVQGEGNPKIRVVFNPDGKVQTFYEGREK